VATDATTVWARVRALDPPSPVSIGILVAAAGLLLDQATKALALEALVGARVIDLPGPIFLRLTFNPGAAFGIPAPWWLILLVTVVVIVLVAANLPRSSTLLEPFAYGMLAGGALGNVTDRLLRPHPEGVGRGEVVDFIASDFWPTFNVADICITVGFGLLVLAAFSMRHDGRGERGPRA
jgi:signal peptidase II